MAATGRRKWFGLNLNNAMNRIISALMLALAVTIAGAAFAQTDAENLEHARNALSVAHNCDDAMRFLNQVSIEGKTNPDYYICMARAQDCKMNNEQARYYSNKYLEYKPANDSVKK